MFPSYLIKEAAGMKLGGILEIRDSSDSGYYANESTGGMDNMTKIFLGADIGLAAVLIAIEAIVLASARKKKNTK